MCQAGHLGAPHWGYAARKSVYPMSVHCARPAQWCSPCSAQAEAGRMRSVAVVFTLGGLFIFALLIGLVCPLPPLPCSLGWCVRSLLCPALPCPALQHAARLLCTARHILPPWAALPKTGQRLNLQLHRRDRGGSVRSAGERSRPASLCPGGAPASAAIPTVACSLTRLNPPGCCRSSRTTC